MLQGDDGAGVDRLHAQLTEALRRSRVSPFDAPVTVAEIYQELIPYRAVKEDLGFEANADYDVALLRLLAGEGERVRIEPPEAAGEIRRELQSARPNLSMYREFAGCDVWVRAAVAPLAPAATLLARPGAAAVASAAAGSAVRGPRLVTDGVAVENAEPENAEPETAEPETAELESAEPDNAEPEDAEPGTGAVFALADGAAARYETSADPAFDEAAADARTERLAGASAAREEGARPLQAVRGASKAAADAVHDAVPAPQDNEGQCTFCESALPRGRTARFCPYCGGDQSKRPCPHCGEVLEGEWSFCIACGGGAT